MHFRRIGGYQGSGALSLVNGASCCVISLILKYD